MPPEAHFTTNGGAMRVGRTVVLLVLLSCAALLAGGCGNYGASGSWMDDQARSDPAPNMPNVTKSSATVSLSEDTAEPADPATLEALVGVGNDFGVQNGGKPIAFTTDRVRRVRQITTYHYNLHKGTSGGGSYTIKRADGTVLGEFTVNRTADGQGGVKNVYWYADVDFELPAGSYTLEDSDPGTWGQNAQSKGIGFGAVLAVK
jgi:hypothetical protein